MAKQLSNEVEAVKKVFDQIQLSDIKLIQLGDEPLYIDKGIKSGQNMVLDYLKYVQGINEHARIRLRFVDIGLDQRDRLINLIGERTKLLIEYGGAANPQTLYCGVVTKADIRQAKSLYCLEIWAASWTYDLDIKLKSRSFNKRKMKYTEIFKLFEKEYPAQISNADTGDAELISLLLQYQETDWRLLKRIAGRLGTGLIVNPLSHKQAFSIGLPGEKEPIFVQLDGKSVLQRIRQRVFDDKGTKEDEGRREYKLVTRQLLKMGDPVTFQRPREEEKQASGKAKITNGEENKIKSEERSMDTLYVTRSVAMLKNGQDDLMWEYTLTPKSGIFSKPMLSPDIAGMSLEGVVLDRIKDEALVQLKIDKEYGGFFVEQYKLDNPNAEQKNISEHVYFKCAAPYTAEGNTGFYVMPEIGDTVQVYFPTAFPDQAYIAQSVRQSNNSKSYLKVQRPNEKYFRTRHGKELKLNEDEIAITVDRYDETQKKIIKTEVIIIKLNQGDGVTISSDKNIKIVAKEKLTLQSENGSVNIAAKTKLDLVCQNCSILMEKGITSLKGNQVRTN